MGTDAHKLRTTITSLAVVGLLAAVGLGRCADRGVPPPPPTDLAPGQLAELTVAAPRSMDGYSPDRFPHWRMADANCDVREAVLIRDGEDVAVAEGCDVRGLWFSEYDDRSISDIDQVDVDHMVPPAKAWQSGADAWTNDQRADFANDMVRPQLHAVTRATKQAKGDRDPSQWKPPSPRFWCDYARRWIAVKHHWRLTITEPEKAALLGMLDTCGRTIVPSAAPSAS
jgi:hypothetical protein